MFKVLAAVLLITCLVHAAQSAKSLRVNGTLPTPPNFEEIGTYGVYYGSRKTYYTNKNWITWDEHITECYNNGLTPLSLDTPVEQEYFMALFRDRADFFHINIGAIRSGIEWVWKHTMERISYSMVWQSGSLNENADCLVISKQGPGGVGFRSVMCSETNAFFCQKIGN